MAFLRLVRFYDYYCIMNINREQKKIEYQSHHEEKGLIRNEKKEGKNKIGESNLVACFDLRLRCRHRK